jgi:hypothetical protein
LSRYFYNADDVRDGLTGVVESIVGDTLKLVGNSRSVLCNTAELTARMGLAAQGPQSLVGKRVRLAVDYVSGHETIRVEAAPATTRAETPNYLQVSGRHEVRLPRHQAV